jgi:hypothetical protein
MTLSIMTLSIMILSIMTLSIVTLIMMLRIKTHSKKVTLSLNDTKHKWHRIQVYEHLNILPLC